MTSEFLRRQSAKCVLGLMSSDDIRRAAFAALEAGKESASLRACAEIEDGDLERSLVLFKSALKDLEVPELEPREAVLSLSRDIAQGIVRGEIGPYQGARRIMDLAVILEGSLPVEIHPFIYAASEWEDRPSDRAHFEKSITMEAKRLVGDS